MKIDEARTQTDKELSKMERQIRKIYREAKGDIQADWQKYMERGERRLSSLADKFGTDSKEYKDAALNITLKNAWYKDMVKATTAKISNANQVALDYVKDQMPEVYAINYNQFGRELEKAGLSDEDGIRFNLVDEATVRRMIKDGDIEMPNEKKRLSIPKDQRWNTKQINSSVLQGIVQGESLKDISKRIFGEIDSKANKEGLSDKELGELLKRNEQAAIRNARTLVTGAESRGRMDSYHEARDEGIVLNKVWLASADGRTRDWHVDLDGQEVGIDEDFVDGKGNKLQYPGDPGGAPETVYNCRCCLTTHVVGFINPKTGEMIPVDYEAEPDAHDRAMEKERARRGRPQPEKAQGNGKTENFVEKIKAIQNDVRNNGVTTERVMQAGKVMADELNPVYNEASEKLREAERVSQEKYVEYKNASAIYNAIFDERDKDINIITDPAYVERLLDAEGKMADAQEAYMLSLGEKKKARMTVSKTADILKSKLSEVREVGGIDTKEHLNNSRSPVRKIVEKAYDYYPTTWVKASVDMGNLTPKTVGRGYYNGWEIAISGWNDDGKLSTAFHELGHRFEDAVGFIRGQEKTFYEKRTAGEELVWLGKGYANYEKTRRDNFLSAYMGKDYGGSAYELVSMGFEYAYTDPTTLAKDAEMQQWILGMLAVVP